MGIDVAFGGLTVPGGVAELQPLAVPAGRPPWSRTPGSTVALGPAHMAGTVTAPRASTRRRRCPGMTWTTLVRARTDDSSMPSTVPAWIAVCSPTAEGDGLLVVEDQGRQGGPGGQLVATVDPPLGLDRIAHLPQPVDVPAQGPDRYLQPFGQLGSPGQ